MAAGASCSAMEIAAAAEQQQFRYTTPQPNAIRTVLNTVVSARCILVFLLKISSISPSDALSCTPETAECQGLTHSRQASLPCQPWCWPMMLMQQVCPSKPANQMPICPINTVSCLLVQTLNPETDAMAARSVCPISTMPWLLQGLPGQGLAAALLRTVLMCMVTA